LVSHDDCIMINFVNSPWDPRREARQFLGLIWISPKSVSNPAQISADFTVSEQVFMKRHCPQLPVQWQGQTEPSLLRGLSDQCNQSQKHQAGRERSS